MHDFAHARRFTYLLVSASSSALLMATPALAQDQGMRYPHMAPLGQYLMDRDAEIALARSAAPETVSRDATVLVLQGLIFIVLLISETLYGRFEIFKPDAKDRT